MAAAEMLINNVKNFIKTTPKSKLYLYIFILIAVVGGSVVGLSFMQGKTTNLYSLAWQWKMHP